MSLTMDFYPTICSIAGIDTPKKVDGINLFPIAKENPERTVYFMRREGGMYGGLCYYAIRKGPYKLLQNTPYEQLQLFNIETDYQERDVLPEDSEELRQLKYELSQHIRRSGNVPWQKEIK